MKYSTKTTTRIGWCNWRLQLMISFNWLWLEIASETVKKSATSLKAIAKFQFWLDVLKWKLQLTFSLNLNWLELEIG